jgi:hypothetical protein
MFGSTFAKSLDRNNRITVMATKISGLASLGLRFVGPSEDHGIVGEEARSGSPAVPDNCSLHGRDK